MNQQRSASQSSASQSSADHSTADQTNPDPASTAVPGFGTRLAAALAERGRLCVGIDPHLSTLRAWDLPETVSGLERCARTMVEAVGQQTAIFKPNSAMFEVFGSAGIAVLERVVVDARAAGALVLLDAKRGDLGSTMASYARAYLDEDSPLAVDALTVNPFLGFGSLAPAIELARTQSKGLYVLCRTSNPEAGQVQQAVNAGRTVAQTILDEATAANAGDDPGHIGLVIGGTLDRLDVDLTGFTGSLLVPGLGAQGGSVADLGKLFGEHVGQVLPASSRDIMSAGPDPEALLHRVRAVQAEAAVLDR